MTLIDFEKIKPYFTNGEINWYLDPYFNKYIRAEQGFNLPKLENYFCFIVKNNTETSYVIVNEDRVVVKDAYYNFEGYGQIEVFINMLKISKYYESNLEF